MQGFTYLENDDALQLDTEKCIGCGSCEDVCPHRIFKLVSGKATMVDAAACMACGACALNCPVGAIEVRCGEGCGCAGYIINDWLAKFRGRKSSDCGC